MRYIIIIIILISGFGFSVNLFAQETESVDAPQAVSPYPFTIDDLMIAFANASIISLDNNQVYSDMVVLVKGDRIQKVGSSENLEVPHGARVIESNGKYLIAGMIPADMLSSENLNLPMDDHFLKFRSYRTVSEGNLANLILMSTNPIDNLNTIEEYDGIMIRGLWYDRESVLKNLDDVKKLYP